MAVRRTAVFNVLVMGLASLPILTLALILKSPNLGLQIAAVAAFVTIIVNSPHFAYSYMLFYSNSRSFYRQMPFSFFVAGIFVPLLLLTYFVLAIVLNSKIMLGFSVNLMTLSVGWHYAKQGFGMLMVDAAEKRNFFSATERTILLRNAYVL